MYLPVRFVQNDDLMSTRRQCYFLLCKHLDLVANDIDASRQAWKLVNMYLIQDKMQNGVCVERNTYHLMHSALEQLP